MISQYRTTESLHAALVRAARYRRVRADAALRSEGATVAVARLYRDAYKAAAFLGLEAEADEAAERAAAVRSML